MLVSASTLPVAVVSADAETCRLIREALADGFHLLETPDMNLAAAVCEAHHPGMMLLDSALPGVLAACADIRSQIVEPPHLVVMIYSLEQVDDCLQAGADDCLFIPVHPRLLRQRAQHLLDARQYLLRLEAMQQALEESNARFQTLFEHSPDAIFLLDYDERNSQLLIQDCNHMAGQMNGYTREDLIGQPASLLTQVEFSREQAASLKDRLRQNGHLQQEGRCYRRDGSHYPVETSSGLVTLGSREIILSIDRDITERRLVQTSEHRQRALAEALRDTAAALNSTLKLADVLDLILLQASRVVAYDAASIALMDGDFARVVRCRGFEDEAGVLQIRFPVDVTPNHRHMLSTRAPFIIPDTSTYPGWINFAQTSRVRSHVAAPLIFRDEVLGFIHLDRFTPNAFTEDEAATLQLFADQAATAVNNAQLYDRLNLLYQDNLRYAADLEQRVEARTAELRRALDREHELGKLRSRFITVASHEFRTPLAVMMTASDLVKNYGQRMTEERRDKHLDQIQQEIKKLTRLLQDVLTVNQGVEGSAQDYYPKRFELAQFCRVILDEARAEDKDGHQFRLLAPEAGLWVMMDQKLVQDILTNLLSNAVKYSPGGSTITLEINSSDTQVVINVQDDGIGIPEDDQKHLYEAFHRASNVREIGGTGLGLTIVKQAAERHGGSISVRSRLGLGSTFTVTIPQPTQETETHDKNSGS